MIVTFTTDFGTRDHFVGTMKGVVLGINPEVSLVDICHEVLPFDVLDGALTIAAAYRYFPPGTIHVVVVDPGVGTNRRPILAEAGGHLFIAPDNGVLSLVFLREQDVAVRHIVADRFFLHPVSATFHGRDVFAPIAAHVSKGIDPSSFGPEVSDFVRLSIPTPRVEAQRLSGVVIRHDRFGNVITNIDAGTLADFTESRPGNLLLRIASREIAGLCTTYAECAPGDPCCLIGSTGYLEVATNQGSAAEQLKTRVGDPVELTLSAPKDSLA